MSDSVVSAVVVTYNPDRGTLLNLLRALAPQVRQIVVADNGATQWLEAQINAEGWTNVSRKDMGGNVGIGRALNIAFEELRSAGDSWVITFDQDSLPPQGMVDALKATACKLLETGEKCAAVGPAFFDERSGVPKRYPFFKRDGFKVRRIYPPASQNVAVMCDSLITSGMLVSMKAWVSTGGFDEGMFVDYTDTEWCFRAGSQGWHFYGLPCVAMSHELSESAPRISFGLIFLSYSPLRRYFYARNTIAVCLRSYTHPVYRLRLLVGLIIRFPVWAFTDTHRVAAIRATLRGVRDGLSGRLGASSLGVK
ncbi:MAG: glycosyltransferase family 2 protein [Nitrososphaerales archaeon]